MRPCVPSSPSSSLRRWPVRRGSPGHPRLVTWSPNCSRRIGPFRLQRHRCRPAEALGRMFADDVIMPAPPNRFVEGRDKAIQALGANPDNLTARAEWTPIRGGISGDARHGFTFGYMTLRRADGTTPSFKYLSYWIRQSIGWRVAAYKRRPRPALPVSMDVMTPALPQRISTGGGTLVVGGDSKPHRDRKRVLRIGAEGRHRRSILTVRKERCRQHGWSHRLCVSRRRPDHWPVDRRRRPAGQEPGVVERRPRVGRSEWRSRNHVRTDSLERSCEKLAKACPSSRSGGAAIPPSPGATSRSRPHPWIRRTYLFEFERHRYRSPIPRSARGRVHRRNPPRPSGIWMAFCAIMPPRVPHQLEYGDHQPE